MEDRIVTVGFGVFFKRDAVSEETVSRMIDAYSQKTDYEVSVIPIDPQNGGVGEEFRDGFLLGCNFLVEGDVYPSVMLHNSVQNLRNALTQIVWDVAKMSVNDDNFCVAVHSL